MSARFTPRLNPRLNRPLVLEEARRSPDSAGGANETWIPVGTLWADIIARSGRERGASTDAVSAMDYRIIVRANPPGSAARPSADQRFREGSRVFRINAVAERDAEGRYLTCFAHEEVAV